MPPGLRIYLTGHQVPNDGLRFVLDITSDKARKWVSLYDPTLLKVLRYRRSDDPRRSPRTKPITYDPKRLRRIIRERAKVFERCGIGYNRGDAKAVLAALGA